MTDLQAKVITIVRLTSAKAKVQYCYNYEAVVEPLAGLSEQHCYQYAIFVGPMAIGLGVTEADAWADAWAIIKQGNSYG